jgi:hypothetical protein
MNFHLHVGLLGGLFPSAFPPKTLFPIRATCPAYITLLFALALTISD